MSYKSYLPAIMVVLILILIGCGERKTVDVEAEKAKIDSSLTASFSAVEQQDWETLSKYVSDDWIHYTHLGTKWSMDEMRDFFAQHIKDHTINLSNKKIEISESGDLAWVTFDENTSLTFDGNPANINAIFTAIFKKQNGEWKMVHLHRSAEMPPMDATSTITTK